MELRQLQTFTQIAQMQSFSRTAEMLGYSQSAVTVQIRSYFIFPSGLSGEWSGNNERD